MGDFRAVVRFSSFFCVFGGLEREVLGGIIIRVDGTGKFSSVCVRGLVCRLWVWYLRVYFLVFC